MCASIADIHSVTAEIRRGKKEERRRKKKPQDKNIMACPNRQGGHNELTEKETGCYISTSSSWAVCMIAYISIELQQILVNLF